MKLASLDDDSADMHESLEPASNPEASGPDGSNDKASGSAVAPERRFRGQRMETPSHPGNVL